MQLISNALVYVMAELVLYPIEDIVLYGWNNLKVYSRLAAILMLSRTKD